MMQQCQSVELNYILIKPRFMLLMIYQLLFKIFKTILPSNAKRKYMYEKSFIVYRCKKKIRQLELKKLRGKNPKIILLSGMNFITSSQCTNVYTSYSQITNKWNTKSFFYFISPAILDVFICVSSALQKLHSISSQIFCYIGTQLKHLKMIVP